MGLPTYFQNLPSFLIMQYHALRLKVFIHLSSLRDKTLGVGYALLKPKSRLSSLAITTCLNACDKPQ